MLKIPILVLTFNRPDHTQKLVEILKALQPERLYISSDGPRPGNETDEKAVRETRALFEDNNWGSSEVQTLFNEKNQGCKLAVSQAINWFFNQEEKGIILEDDCLPNSSFFKFCGLMLERYKVDDRVMHISGSTFIGNNSESLKSDYYYSCYPHCWGWATWRRAWKKFDYKMEDWPLFKKGGYLTEFISNPIGIKNWEKVFDTTYEDKNTSWAYRWTYSCWKNNGLSIHPKKNLVKNIGFDEFATHTKYISKNIPDNSEELKEPFSSPRIFVREFELDNYIESHHFNSNFKHEILKGLRKIKKWLLK